VHSLLENNTCIVTQLKGAGALPKILNINFSPKCSQMSGAQKLAKRGRGTFGYLRNLLDLRRFFNVWRYEFEYLTRYVQIFCFFEF